jgi:hypothetical protein
MKNSFMAKLREYFSQMSSRESDLKDFLIKYGIPLFADIYIAITSASGGKYRVSKAVL